MRCSPELLAYLTVEAGMSECVYNVGVAQVLSQGDFHWGPIRSALDVLVLFWRNDLHKQKRNMYSCCDYEQHVGLTFNMTCQPKAAIALMQVSATGNAFEGVINCQ